MATITVDLQLSKDCLIQIEGNYISEDPGIHTYRNGDPGYPPSPSELEIEGISFLKGGLLEYTNWANDIMEKGLKHISEGKNRYYVDCIWDILINLAIEQYEKQL